MNAPLFDGRPVTARAATLAGVPRRRFLQLVADGSLRSPVYGVYVDAAVPDSIDLRAAAVGLVIPADAVLAGVTAAWVLGVPPLLPGAHETPPPIDVLRPPGTAPVRRRGFRGRVARLPHSDIVEIGGVRLTNALRTTLDLARFLDRPDGLAYVDAMLRAELVGAEELAAGVDALTGRSWVEQARELVGLGDARAESPGESWMRLRWVDAGLPALDLQIPVRHGGVVAARLDAGLPDRRFGLEYDGLDWHGPERQRHDEERREWLRGQGWDVLVVGREHVLGRGFDFEAAVAERTGLQPELVPWELRRRSYLYRRRRA